MKRHGAFDLYPHPSSLLLSMQETNSYGRIVNITSPVGLYGNFGCGLAQGLKAAVSQGLRMKLFAP